jgi:ribosomal protein S21
MVEVKRRKGESFDALLRRFAKRVQLSGQMLEAKKHRFHTHDKNKTALKKSALRRLETAARREFLLKTGRLTEEEEKKSKTRRR